MTNSTRMYNPTLEDPARIKIKLELKRASINYFNDESTKSLSKKLGAYRVAYAKENPKFKKLITGIIQFIIGKH